MFDWRADVRARLAGAGLTPEDEAQIVDELAQHLEDQYADLCARGDPATARETLLAQLRDEAFTRSVRRRRPAPISRFGARLDAAGGLWRDAVLAVRSLSRAPGVAIPGVVALALGIGLTTAMFSVIYGVLLIGLPFRDSDRIATVSHFDPASPGEPADAMASADFDAYRSRQHSLQLFGAYSLGAANASGGDRPDRISVARMSAEAFEVTGVHAMLGRTVAPADDAVGAPPVAVLGYGTWRDRFASDSGVLGRTLRVNDQAYTIVGVMPERFSFPNAVQAWLPLQIDRATLLDGGPSVTVVGRLRSDATFQTAGAEFSRLATIVAAERGPKAVALRAVVQPFIRTVIRPQVYVLFYTMLGAVILVLLVACANVANLLLHRAADRMKETGVRAALGASRAVIVRRALVESLLLAGVASVLGTAIAQAFIVWFNHALPVAEGPFWIDIRLHLPVLAFTIVIAIAAGVVAGVLPAIQSARIDVSAILKDDVYGVSALRIGRLSRGVIVVEIAAASAMLVAAGFITKSMIRLRELDPGFRTTDVLTAQVSLSTLDTARQRRFFADLETALSAAPGVEAVSLGSGLPGTGWSTQPIAVEGRTYAVNERRQIAGRLAVGAGFFRVFGVKLLRGRGITTDDRAGSPRVAVVSESFVRREFREADPIGKRIRFGSSAGAGDWLTIVGVVPTMYADAAQNRWPAEVLTAFAQGRSRASASIALVGTGDLAASLRKGLAALDPEVPLYQVATMDDLITKSMWPMRVFGGAFVMFGLAALVLAAIGLYAVMAFSVSRRVRELGIRLALGATRMDVVRMICRQAAVTIGAGMSVGLLAGAGAAQALRAVLFGISANDPSVFLAIGAVLASVALIACLVPALRATRLDPVTALRAE